MAQDTEVPTEPELERRTRRKFSSADKRRLLAEYDSLVRGEKGAWLRRQGLRWKGRVENRLPAP